MVMVAMPFVGPPGRQVAVVGDTARAFRIVAEAGGRLVVDSTPGGGTRLLAEVPVS